MASRTLCTENDFALFRAKNGTDLHSENDKTIMVTVSTASVASVNFSLNVSRENNFLMS